MAMVVEGRRGRLYVPPDPEHAEIAMSAQPQWGPEDELSTHPQYMAAPRYGLTRFRDLFSRRQLVALTVLSDLIGEARDRVLRDANEADLPGGSDSRAAYADAVATYLAFAVDKTAEYGCTLVPWDSKDDRPKGLFARQAIPMLWDFAEVNPLGEMGGTFQASVRVVADALVGLPTAGPPARVSQRDAAQTFDEPGVLISTDPPYYDNVPYADLSDFFYVWLRRALFRVYPNLFGTLLTPKGAELVADSVRFGGRAGARDHFEAGLGAVFANARAQASHSYPVSIYYAFRQAESDDAGGFQASSGWETMLEGLLRSGFAVVGTWPVRTERATRSRELGSNALASSIVLVCRPRDSDTGITTRKDFIAALKREMPEALRTLQHGNIAPVDLAQSSIGPGMAIFSRYAKVLEPDGSEMRVRTALALINQALDELLTEQEGEFDADTRWAIAWYEQFGLSEAAYGTAETLSKAKNSSVAGLVEAGIVAASRGRVRLLERAEYSLNWDPAKDSRVPVWEATQRLVHALLADGESAAGDLLAHLGGLGDTARDLAYRMYHVAERKGWTDEARAYNALVVAWTDLSRGAESTRAAKPAQTSLGLE